MNKNLTIPNPFSYFMQLSKTVKMAIIIGLFTLVMTFMYFTYQAGYWGDFMAWLFNSADEAKK